MPEEGKKVILWRYKHRNYTIAMLEKNTSDEGQFAFSPIIATKKSDKWRSHSGNALNIQKDDYWAYFQTLTVTKEYL